MIIFLSVFLAFSCSKTFAAEKSIEKRVSGHIQTITSTNNADVYLRKIKSQLTAQAFTEYKNLLKNSKSQMYQAKKLGRDSFALKFSGDRWVKIKYDTKAGKVFVGKKEFRWNVNKSATDNIQAFSQIVNSQYPPKKESALWFFNWIPEAKAQLFGRDNSATVVAGAAASLEPSMGLDRFLTTVENHCNNHPLAHLRREYFNTENRGQLRVDFEAAKTSVGQIFSAKHGFGFAVNHHLIGRFHQVQLCLRNQRILSDSDLLPIEFTDEEQERGRIIESAN